MFSDRHPMYEKYKSLRGGIYVIEGIVGVGKTTLGKSIETYLNNIGIDCKFYREYVNHDLLNQFISDMKKYAYSFQMIMLLKRIEIYREAEAYTKLGGVAIVDRSLFGDKTFAKLHYQDGNISEDEWNIYNKYILSETLPTPSACVYLQCSPEISLQRLKNRGIESEINGYNIEYVTKLNNIYQNIITNCNNVKIFTLDWVDIPIKDKIPDHNVNDILKLLI